MGWVSELSIGSPVGFYTQIVVFGRTVRDQGGKVRRDVRFFGEGLLSAAAVMAEVADSRLWLGQTVCLLVDDFHALGLWFRVRYQVGR